MIVMLPSPRYLVEHGIGRSGGGCYVGSCGGGFGRVGRAVAMGFRMVEVKWSGVLGLVARDLFANGGGVTLGAVGLAGLLGTVGGGWLG